MKLLPRIAIITVSCGLFISMVGSVACMVRDGHIRTFTLDVQVPSLTSSTNAPVVLSYSDTSSLGKVTSVYRLDKPHTRAHTTHHGFAHGIRKLWKSVSRSIAHALS